MARQPVLVTGAGGATGGAAVEALIEMGVPVRAMVRKEDDRSAVLREKGADVVLGDLLDFDSLRSAMEGTTAAYLVYPLVQGLISASTYFAVAAQYADVTAIVNMSQISARRDSKSHQARDHWFAERVLDWSGISTTHLRPTLFAQWLTYPRVSKAIERDGTISLPFGEGRYAPIAAEDQGRVIAAILADPLPHAGATYKLFGPVEMDQHGIAEAVGEALGRRIVYRPISIEDFEAQIRDFGLPGQTVQHLTAIAQDVRDGLFAGTNDLVRSLTGSPPMTVQAFVELHKRQLGG